jgi:CBS domain-containing protein
MTVKSMLDRKGRNVVTIHFDASLNEALQLLAQKDIGALVVVDENNAIRGIISERDIVRLLARRGAGALDTPVSGTMTTNVLVCHEQDTVNQVMEKMTNHRIRHLPVEKDGRLDGIISIGDVVKQRIADVEREAAEIRNYIDTA